MRFISFVLSIFMCLATSVMAELTVTAPENPDDGFTPVMRFVSTSDTHINTLGDTGCQRMAKMIKSAYMISDSDEDYKNLDAVVFSGDITDNGMFNSFAAFTAITDMELREGTERLGVIAKNHDSYLYSAYAPTVYEKVTGQESDFHKVVNGFHFIGVSRSKTLAQYSPEQIQWLDENLAQAVKESPEKPVFVFQHEHVRDTVYGSSKSDGWGLEVFTDVLKKYPQAIHISGHSHFPANDPRAIWQDSFTAINAGGLGYFEFAVDGKNGIHPDGYKDMTQALIIEVDADNRVLVRVLDVDKGVFLREFLIDNVADAKKEKYNHDVRKANSVAPGFSEDASLKVEKDKMGRYVVTVPQASVSGDNEVFLYRLTVTDENGKTIHKDWTFSEYYFAQRPDTVSFDAFLSLKGNFTVTVAAEDVWGNQSETLSAAV